MDDSGCSSDSTKDRPLVGRSESVGQHDFQKHTDCWMEDGTIILVCQAELHQSATGFRTYRGLLSQKCEVFHDMFTVCDAPQTNVDTYEGCPLVVMQDRPEDLHRLLRYVMEKDFGRELRSLTLEELGSLLRMSTKYVFRSLRDEIIVHLEILYPSKLEDFQSTRRKSLLPEDFSGIFGVNLGLQCDIPSILPTAYYICSINIPLAELHDASLDYKAGSITALSPAGFRALLIFNENFDRSVWAGGKLTLPKSWNCTINYCRDDILDQILFQDMQLQNRRDRHLIFLPYASIPRRSHQLCRSCVTELRTRRNEIQRVVWDMLPSCTGLRNWTSLSRDA